MIYHSARECMSWYTQRNTLTHRYTKYILECFCNNDINAFCVWDRKCNVLSLARFFQRFTLSNGFCSFTCPNIQLRIWNAIKWFYGVLYVLHFQQQSFTLGFNQCFKIKGGSLISTNNIKKNIYKSWIVFPFYENDFNSVYKLNCDLTFNGILSSKWFNFYFLIMVVIRLFQHLTSEI